MPYDLFGEIPVTEPEVRAWVAAVAPRWLSPDRAYRNYVASWNVPDKIRRAKLEGTFYAIVARPREPYHVRLALASMV